MKNAYLFIVFGIFLLAASTPSAQDEHGHEHEPKEEMMVEEPAGTVEEGKELVYVNNKICPLSGEEIGSMGPGATHEYSGKVYSFCCAMCVDEFMKDPEKYVKILQEKMASEKEEAETVM